MSYVLAAVAGLGLALGSTALAEEVRAPAVDLVEVEVAPGAAVGPLNAFTSATPIFVLVHGSGATVSADLATPATLSVGTSGLLAFGVEGVRMPEYQPDIVTGALRATPR